MTKRGRVVILVMLTDAPSTPLTRLLHASYTPPTASGDVDGLDGCHNASHHLCFSICTFVPVKQVKCLLHASYTPPTASGDVDSPDGRRNASHLLRRNRPRYSLTRL